MPGPILDRVLGRLFPTAQYAGLLGPGGEQQLQAQGLLKLGTGLLGDTGPGNAFSALGRSVQGLNFPEMAGQAVAVQDYRKKLANEAAIADIVRAHPAKKGETPSETYARLGQLISEFAGVPGTEHLIGPLSNALIALREQKSTPSRPVVRPAMVDKTTGKVTLDSHNAVLAYASFDPETGEQIGTAKGAAPPKTQYFIGPNGEIIYGTPAEADVVPGARAAVPGQQSNAQQDKKKLGAANAAEAARAAVALVDSVPDANVYPTSAAWAGGIAESKAGEMVGLSPLAGAAQRRAMTDEQTQFQNLLNVVAHNAVGLLPGSRQSLVLFKNLRETYASGPGDPPGLRKQKVELLRRLGHQLERMAAGEEVDLSEFPGFEDFVPSGTSAPGGKPSGKSAAPSAAPSNPFAKGGRLHVPGH